ncbi:unnamed protein product [Auanema sp. JU1783]|nr:unnamed protein product [Auanema sp. JU1783]
MQTSKESSPVLTNSRKDVLYFFLLNLASSFMLSAAHNVLHFVLDFHTTLIHFLHYFFTFLFMLLLYKSGCIPKTSVQYQNLYTPVGLKVLEVLLSSIVHSQNRTGALYTTRIFDFLFTLTICFNVQKYVPSRVNGHPKAPLLIPLGLSVSLAWMEFGQMEYTAFSLLCSPILAIVRGLCVLKIQEAHIQMYQGHVEQFCLYYSGLVSLALSFPAFISYATSHVEVTASWESIDYVLMGLSFLFMSSNVYSELWLILNTNPRAFAAFDHTKNLGASIAQWIIQNMAHPNILALGGKIVAIASIFRILTRL